MTNTAHGPYLQSASVTTLGELASLSPSDEGWEIVSYSRQDVLDELHTRALRINEAMDARALEDLNVTAALARGYVWGRRDAAGAKLTLLAVPPAKFIERAIAAQTSLSGLEPLYNTMLTELGLKES